VSLFPQVNSTSLLLSETITPMKRLPIVRMETHGCKTVLHMQPDKLQLNFEMASITALDLCAHGPGIAEVILSRVPAEAGVRCTPSVWHVYYDT
jgi:hypothetical protein